MPPIGNRRESQTVCRMWLLADLIKILWHDGLGMSLYAKRLERGRFIWPAPADGIVAITPSQLAYMLDGIDWRNQGAERSTPRRKPVIINCFW